MIDQDWVNKHRLILTSNLKYIFNKCFVDMTQTIFNSFLGNKQNYFNGLTNKHNMDKHTAYYSS